MGSAISLFNTTQNTWLAKIIHTTWNWSSLSPIAADTVGYINRNVPNSRLALRRIVEESLPNSLVYELSGLTSAVIDGMLRLSLTNGTWASAFVNLMSRQIRDHEGCASIAPNGSYRVDGLTLSLIRRGVCYRVIIDPTNQNQILANLLLMHPIFSGPTANSTNVYHMQDWINTYGLDAALTIRLDPASLAVVSRRSATIDASISVNAERDFIKASLEAKQKALEEAGMDQDLGVCEKDD